MRLGKEGNKRGMSRTMESQEERILSRLKLGKAEGEWEEQ